MATAEKKATVIPMRGLKHHNRTIENVLSLGSFSDKREFYAIGPCSKKRILRELENYTYSEFKVMRSSWTDIFKKLENRRYIARISLKALKSYKDSDGAIFY